MCRQTTLTMKLERLEALPQSGRVKLVFEDGSSIKTQPYLIADFGLYAGLELDEEQMQALHAAVKKASARERAVRIVAASNVSEKELRRRLVQRGEDEQDSAQAVAWLRQLNLLDDRKTAQQIVSSAAAKGYGRARIRNLLYEKGIPRELWDEALQQIPPMDDALDRFLRQRFKDGEPDEKTVKKAVDALLRRGHSWGEIQCALRRYHSGLELEDEQWMEETQ